MTIATMYTYLMSKVAASSGIVTATTSLPDVINDGALPLVVGFVGPGAWRWQAQGLKRHERTFTFKCLTAPINQGTQNEVHDSIFAPMDALGRTFLNMIGPSQTTDIDSLAGDITDSPGVDIDGYHGFTFTLTAVEKGT